MMKCFYKCALLFLTLVFNASTAQVVADGWVLESIHGPSQMGIVDTIPVDINHDGLMDVVSASIDDGHLRAYINQGGSTDLSNVVFEEMFISKQVPGIYRVSEIDINHDGQVDFLLPSIESQEIILLVADSTAQPYGYRKQIIASDILLPTDAQAGDFNRDGLIDVVSISFELNRVYLHLQNLQGTFDTQIIADSILRPRKILVENYNNDAQMDFMVVSSEDDSVRLFENQGNALFDEQLISNQMTGARFIASCDIDGNGWVDFVVSATSIDSVYSFTNLGNGAFTEQLIGDDLLGANALHCADVDDDGKTEVMVVSSTIDSIHLLEISQESDQTVIAAFRDGYISLDAFDFNADGKMELITQTYFEQKNLLYDISTLKETVIWEDYPEGIISIQKQTTQDDVFAASFFSGEITRYLNGDIETVFAGLKGLRALEIDDLNQDLQADLFSLNSETGEAFFHLQNGQGLFNTNLVSNQLGFPTATQAINISKKKHVLIGTTFDDQLWAFDGLVLSSLGNVYSGTFAFDVADFNGDDLEDAVLADFINGQISIATQSESGGFDKTIISYDKPRVFSVKAIDLDGDNDLDIVSTVNLNNEIWWHENNGNSFTDHLISSNVIQPRDLDVTTYLGRKYIAVSSFVSNTGGVYLFDTANGDAFNESKIHSNINGSNTLKFIDDSAGLSLLVGGFNDNSLIQITQMDLIFISTFEIPKN